MLVVLFSFLFVGVIAEPWPGMCPNVTLLENIDLNKFLGKWYVSHIYVNDKIASRGCMLLDYQKDNNSFTLNSVTFDEKGNKVWKESIKLDRSADATNDGQLLISIRYSNDKIYQFPLFILSTDYTDYAIMYSCKISNQGAVDVTHDVNFWVLIKQKGKLEGETLHKVEKALSGYSSLTENKSLAVNDFKAKDVCNI